ncbi:uncharacterized protein LOC129241840 isoform X2 [Anastrepha obliqua]|uniref:uncharacterized protein LOC129241840 isoform X2 n=1 Tax=Anastrepha obliqua TaxID=95512 RepID=UPI00240A413A|nr:uncharacterized protein LOC129241840 isoform X2 [Anastrepha obliqua]
MEFFVSTAFVILCGLSQLITVNGEFVKCQTPNGSAGSCKLIDACESIYKLATRDYLTEDEMHFLQQSKCGVANNKPIVCCPTFEKPSMPTETSTTRTTTTTTKTLSPTTTTKSEVISGEICRTPNGTLGECKAWENCDSLWNLHQMEHLTQEQLTFLDESECETSDMDKDFVCCPEDGEEHNQAEVKKSSASNSCQTSNAEEGDCVRMEECQYLTAKKEADILFLKRNRCGSDVNSRNICCPKHKPDKVIGELKVRTVGNDVASFEPCVTSYMKKGECMPIRNCSILLNLVLKPDKTDADIVFLQSNQCGYVNNSPLVCCPTFEKPSMPTETSTTRTTTTTTTLSPTTTTKSEVISGEICRTPNGTLGECKARENCDSLWNLHQMEHLTQEQLTFLDESECETSDMDKVCCPKDIPKLEEAAQIATPAFAAPTPDLNECQTPNGVAGTCISIITCDSLMKIMNKSDFLNNDVKYLKASFCADADNFPKVCCPNDMSMPAEANLPMPPYCGRVVAENVTDVVAVRTTDIDEYPWTALLIYTNARGRLSFRCGGTLIHERYVLTGVHCLIEESASSTLTGVRLGEWATQAKVDCQSKEQHSEVCAPPHIDMGVEKLTMHPEYDSLNNEIALLRLASAVQFTRFLSPICLPFEISQQSRIVEGTTLHVAGWGATSNGELRNLKMTSTVTVENLAECIRLFRTSGLVNLTPEHICAAGTSAAESVVHDSGGALMSMQEIGKVQSYFLVGIDTLSYEYALQRDFPGLYTRINAYLEWIKNEIENN